MALEVLDWQAAASIVNLSPNPIGTPRKFVDGQILAHTALLRKIKRLEAKIKTYEALLSN